MQRVATYVAVGFGFWFAASVVVGAGWALWARWWRRRPDDTDGRGYGSDTYHRGR